MSIHRSFAVSVFFYRKTITWECLFGIVGCNFLLD